jgi:hypothetical protein
LPAADPAEFSPWIGEGRGRFVRSAFARALATIPFAVVLAFGLAQLDLLLVGRHGHSAQSEWTVPVHIRVAGDHFELCQASDPSRRLQPDDKCCSRPVSVRLLGNGKVLPWQDGDFLDCMPHPSR